MRREGREREDKIIRRKRGRGERGGNTCEICFQKVIPPTLPASPTLVSGQAWFPVFPPPPSPTHNDNDNDNVLFGVLYSPIHRIHKWRTRGKKLVPSHESEALEDKQKLQMKTFSELAEC